MKYIGFFNSENNSDENRIYHLSACNKMLYIAETLNELGEEVEIISPSWTLNNKFYKKKRISLNDKQSLILGPTIPYVRGVSHLISLIWVFFFLLFNTQKKETVLVYHSLLLMGPILLLKKIKKLEIILEVEEIYNMVWNGNNKQVCDEINYINKMDKRILVSKTLNKIVGNDNDIILYGSYISKRNKNVVKESKTLVFAGGIEKLRAGAFLAVDLMSFFPKEEKFTLYILGNGEKKIVNELIEKINVVNIQRGYESIIYLGEKKGEQFDGIMNSLSIALNLQNTGEYMDSAFPSKILSYLSYGQIIISTRVSSIINSPFSDYIYFLDKNDFSDISKIISNMNSDNFLNKQVDSILPKLHIDFKNKLSRIIKEKKI